MRPNMVIRLLTVAVVLGLGGAALPAQSWQMPSDAERCPSKWGAKDQLGSGNLMKPEMALRAAKLIRTGEVFQLGSIFPRICPDRQPPFRSPHEARHRDGARNARRK